MNLIYRQDERWRKILECVRGNPGTYQAAIARAVNAHPSTVRKDLTALEKRRLVALASDNPDKRCNAYTLGEWA